MKSADGGLLFRRLLTIFAMIDGFSVTAGVRRNVNIHRKRLLYLNMKRLLYTLFCAFFLYGTTNGQDINSLALDTIRPAAAPMTGVDQHQVESAVALCPDESALSVHPSVDEYRPDSLCLPSLDAFGRVPIGLYPMGFGGLYNWDLHEGLNVNLGASVFGAFGKNAPRGAGFGQNISAMYAIPLTNKWSLAIGGYFNNMYWDNRSFRDGGLNAVVGYKFDEHWEAYLYGQKSIVNKPMPLPLYDINGLGDRIGAAVKYKFNDKFSVTVSVEDHKY